MRIDKSDADLEDAVSQFMHTRQDSILKRMVHTGLGSECLGL